MRFRVKAHGSELEYAMRGRPDLARWGAETLAGAEVVYAGSEHIRDVLEDVVGHVDRVEVVPPGVDVDEFRPEPREEAIAALLEEARADPPNPGNAEERLPDEGNAARFVRFFAREQPTVVYFGKLIENKGVQVLLEAIAGLDARAVVVGFGDFRDELEALAPVGTLFTGPLEHRHLRHLLPLCDVAVVPSIFPEAFGMVAAEAAAAGVLPVVSAHSGLAEVAAGIGAEVGPEAAALLSFPAGDAARAARAARGDPRASGRGTPRARPCRAPSGRAALGLAGGRGPPARVAPGPWSRIRTGRGLAEPNLRRVPRLARLPGSCLGVRHRACLHETRRRIAPPEGLQLRK